MQRFLLFLVCGQLIMSASSQGRYRVLNAAQLPSSSSSSGGSSNRLSDEYGSKHHLGAEMLEATKMPALPDATISTTPETMTPEPKSAIGFGEFNAKLLNALVHDDHAFANLLYSPISIQTMMGLIYRGAKPNSQTAKELSDGLSLSSSIEHVNNAFMSVLYRQNNETNFKLFMANKLYHADTLTVQTTFKNDARIFFDTEIENVNFARRGQVAKSINTWTTEKTSNLIRKSLTADDIASDSTALLINSIYMKALWNPPFSKKETDEQKFFAIQKDGRAVIKPVPMMFNEFDYYFANFTDTLRASMIALPFKDTDIKMYLILPNQMDGLTDVEKRLQGMDFLALTKQLQLQEVTLRLPRFKITSKLNLVPTLRMLNISKVFSDSAELDNLFTSSTRGVGISNAKQSAVLDVNEAGVEAAATSFSVLTPLSLRPLMKYFTCDHPFIFILADDEVIYFAGHVYDPMHEAKTRE